MSELVKVSSKGLLTLPKSIRQQLDINIGDYLDITIETGKVVLQKIDITPKITDQIQLSKNSALGDSLRSYTPCSRSPSPTPTFTRLNIKNSP